jgi:hippurate hydrolase
VPLEQIRSFHHDLTRLRHDLHAHPELGMEEHRTADIVARMLEAWGIEVHRGVGRTGVVGVLRAGNGQGAIGLRAEMDALPIQEATGLDYASQHDGRMHACGHDGHTIMLLGTARYLAETRNFNGTVNLIFQPGEEGLGGAEAMLKDGLFERFPCDSVFAIHNRPGLPVGRFAISPAASAAGGAFFDITITGKGSHAARPETSVDPVLVASHIVAALQSVVARNIAPHEPAVLSITRMSGGNAYNVIPQTAAIGGTARAYSEEVMRTLEENMRRLAESVAAGFGATATLDFRALFAPLVNDPAEAEAAGDAAADLVGEAAVNRAKPPAMGSEDFSFMLQRVPGAWVHVGNGEASAPLHNHLYDFADEAIPYGAGLFARLVERKLPRGTVG